RMSKIKRTATVKRGHTRRNISLLATGVVIVIIIVALSIALSPPATYVMVVHIYDRSKVTSELQTLTDFTESIAVHNVTVTVSGPNYNATTRGPAPDGIVAWGPDDHLLAGSYTIMVSSTGYANSTVSYILGPNCFDKTTNPDQCHPLVPM